MFGGICYEIRDSYAIVETIFSSTHHGTCQARSQKLAELEQAGRLSAVVTQNIDGLHPEAVSKKVYELHGSVHRNYCQRCHDLYDVEFIRQSTGIPLCDCGGVIKPDVALP
jgi:NAD-dependent deacetylase